MEDLIFRLLSEAEAEHFRLASRNRRDFERGGRGVRASCQRRTGVRVLEVKPVVAVLLAENVI